MKHKNRVMIVHLRRPDRSGQDEARSDPFWEFGSFGMAKCHGHNLMNPSKAERLSGVRLAFAQGGPLGARLVYLTPPVEIKRHRDRVEAVWSHPKMPFRYSSAPILVSNTERSHFPRLEAAMAGGGRSKPEGQFSSNFRTRSHCLDDATADKIVGVYTEMRRRAPRSAIARSYDEALPWPPPKVDGHRERTYERLLAEAREGGSTPKDLQKPSGRRC